MNHKTTWEEAIKELQYDVRFKALKSVGEKKNVFQNFLAKKLRDFVETERVRKKQAKLDFQTMLREVDYIAHNTRFRDVQEKLCKDERYSRVDSERERSDLFEDFVMELEKAEKERLYTHTHTHTHTLTYIYMYSIQMYYTYMNI